MNSDRAAVRRLDGTAILKMTASAPASRSGGDALAALVWRAGHQQLVDERR